MPERQGGVAHERFQLDIAERPRIDLTFRYGTECGGASHLTAQAHAFHCRPDVDPLAENIQVDIDGIGRFRAGKADLPAAVRPDQAGRDRPCGAGGRVTA
jgi:hypothetical protein